jgi:hypothetical protein
MSSASSLLLARDYCANWQPGNICTGVDVRLDGSQVRFRPEGAACQLCSGERCAYLEESVLPMVEQCSEWKNDDETRTVFRKPAARAFREAVDLYRREHPETPSHGDASSDDAQVPGVSPDTNRAKEALLP